MRYENRDPHGKKLFKIKIEGDCTLLKGKEYRGRDGEIENYNDSYKCSILSQFLISGEENINKIFHFIKKNFEFKVSR
jgi:hypothetical protein